MVQGGPTGYFKDILGEGMLRQMQPVLQETLWETRARRVLTFRRCLSTAASLCRPLAVPLAAYSAHSESTSARRLCHAPRPHILLPW